MELLGSLCGNNWDVFVNFKKKKKEKKKQKKMCLDSYDPRITCDPENVLNRK